MGVPLAITAKKLNDYFEVMCKAVFQAGLSWAAIDKKWSAFREVFFDFEPEQIAKFSSKKIEQILNDKSVLVNEKKLKATIHNAQALIALDKQNGSFAKYLHSFENYDALATDLKKQFSYLGDMNVYYFLFRVGEPVPPFESWIKTIKGEHPRMKEMVELSMKAKQEGETGDALNQRR